MAIIAKDKGGDFKPVPAGTHVAVCTHVIDMGVQAGGKFKPTRKVYLRWELPNEQTEWADRDGVKHTGPMVIGKQYTLSLNEKATLRGDLEAWRGKTFSEQELAGFDLVNVLGKPCMLGVTHNTNGNKTYANISAVMGLSKGMPVPKAAGPLVQYSIEEHDQRVLESLPGWLQDAIKDRVADDSKTVPSGSDTSFVDDDIPF